MLGYGRRYLDSEALHTEERYFFRLLGCQIAAHMELHETLCSMPVCPHPQCWVSFRRIEQGHPRTRPLGAVTRMPSLDPAGGLPVLSVTSIPVSQTPAYRQDAQQLNDFTRTAVYNLYNSATYSMDKILFPGVNSYQEISETSRRAAPRPSLRKPHQVVIMDSCLQELQRKPRRMVWVPNTQHKTQKQMREKPLKVQITELTFTNAPVRTRRENWDPDVPKNRRPNKPPTGGCPQNLSLSSSPTVMQSHDRKWTTTSSLKDFTEESIRSKRRGNVYCSDVDLQSDPGLDGALLENRRAILHNIREKQQHTPTIPQTVPVYRLNEQLDALDNMEIDLRSIKNQYYLWKKYIGLAGPTYRIKPTDHKVGKGQRQGTLRISRQVGNIGLFPHDLDSALRFYKQQVTETPAGSTVCDTERSRDTDIRDSPSLDGFSQTSFAEEEPFNTPAESESGNLAEDFQENLGQKEAEELKQKDKDTPQTIPDREQGNLPAEEESERQTVSPQPPASNISASEMTDTKKTPDQGAVSPQPKPPPPSPMHSSIS